jgi:hypothetical protein
MLPVSLDCFCFVFPRRIKTKQKQSRETDNMGYTRRRQTKQKQSRETGNMGYTRQRKTKQRKIHMAFDLPEHAETEDLDGQDDSLLLWGSGT